MSDYRNHTPSTTHPDTRTAGEKAAAQAQAEADLDARFSGPNWIGAKVHHDDRPQRVPILGGIMVAERGVITVTAPTGQRFGLTDAYQVAAEHGTGALLRVDTLDERGGVVDWRSAHRVTTRWTFEAPAATTCPIHGAGCEAWA